MSTLRSYLSENSTRYEDEFRNSTIVVREYNTNKLIYKGKAITIDRTIIDRDIMLYSNEKITLQGKRVGVTSLYLK